MSIIKFFNYFDVAKWLLLNVLILSSCKRSVAENSVSSEILETDLTNRTIDDIITPSDICKEIVARFASAISNFTLCSVTNARPIHLCQWCVHKYIVVCQTHNDFTATIDEKGNPCQEYFTNLDRIEIVTDAYKYVKNLWMKGKCDYCFRKYENGTIEPRITDDTSKFQVFYEETKSCFDMSLANASIDTCKECQKDYSVLNQFYINIGEKVGENFCLDIVDTMNTTREIWSGTFHCLPAWKMDIWLNVAMGITALLFPISFYVLAAFLSNKQEARVLHQRRLAEVFAVTSQSDPSSSHVDGESFNNSGLNYSFPANRTRTPTENIGTNEPEPKPGPRPEPEGQVASKNKMK